MDDNKKIPSIRSGIPHSGAHVPKFLPNLRFLAGVVALALLLWLPSLPALAQPPVPAEPGPDLEKRVRELEETVRRLQAERGQGQPSAPAGSSEKPGQTGEGQSSAGTSADAAPDGAGAGAEGPVRGDRRLQLGRGPTGPPGGEDIPETGTRQRFLAGWDRGFYLRSRDWDFDLRITGQIQADYHAFPNPHDATDIDTFLVRRARLGIEADVFRYFEFRLLPDFGQNQPTITDAYLNVHYINEFQLSAGKFKQPFSYEQLIQDRFVPTAERSLIDQLTPQRDEGVMIHGEGLFGKIDWGLSVFNGEINGNQDTNDRKDVAWRLAAHPFYVPGTKEKTLLGDLLVGVAMTTGIEQEPVAPTPLRTPSTIPWFNYNNGVRANGLRSRYTAELAYFYGPLGFLTQGFYMQQKLSPSLAAAAPIVNVPYNGGFVLATLLLTGEERRAYSVRLRPLRAFDPRSPLANPGAWELVGRVSRLHVDSRVFQPGAANLASPNGNSLGTTEMTLGFNWYLDARIRVQFNWEHDWFDQPVRLGLVPTSLRGHADALILRFQVIF
jgi:phosphate-selective porin OprO/OprP